MALKVSAGGGDFEQVPVGQTPAICYKIVDAGTREEQWKDDPPKPRHLIFINWELPEHQLADGRPMSIHKQYTHSLNENSNLFKDLKSWRGRAFTAEELAGFDLMTILGVSCDLDIVKNANDRSVVDSVFKPDGGAKKTETVNELQAFDLEEYCNEFNGNSSEKSKEMCDVYEDLPPFMQTMITESFEVKAAMEKGGNSPKPNGGLGALATEEKATEDLTDDDIPF